MNTRSLPPKLSSEAAISGVASGFLGLPTDISSPINDFLHEYLGTASHSVPIGGRGKELAALNAWLNDPSASPYGLLAAEDALRQHIQNGQLGKYLVIQIKYALCRSSVMASSANIPPELLARAVQHSLLTPAQALVIVRQTPSEHQRANALSELAPYLPENAQREALAMAWQLANEQNQVRALCGLAKHLSLDLLSQVLATVQEIRHEGKRTNTFCGLAQYLPLELLTETMAIADTISDKTRLAGALYEFAQQLPELQKQEILRHALTMVRSMKNETKKVPLLMKISKSLPPAEKQQVWRELLVMIRHQRGSEQVLRQIIWHLPQSETQTAQEALATVRAVRDKNVRPFLLAELAGRLAEPEKQELLHEVLTAARSIRSESSRVEMLSVVAKYLSPPEKQEVLREALVVARVSSESEQTYMLCELTAQLPPSEKQEVLRELLATVHTTKNERLQRFILRQLLPHLPPSEQQEVLRQILVNIDVDKDYMAIKNEALQFFCHIIKYYSHTILKEILDAIRAIKNESLQASVLCELVPHLPPTNSVFVGEILAMAREMRYERHRADVLRTLLPVLPPSEEQQVRRAGRPVLREWLAIVMKNPSLLKYEFLKLAYELPSELLSQVLAAMAAIRDQDVREEALYKVAMYLPESKKQQVLREALAACAIGDEKQRAEKLSRVTKYLPSELLSQALATVLTIKEDRWRESALYNLAPHLLSKLPAEQIGPLFQAVHHIKDAAMRTSLLSQLFVYLSEPEKQEVLPELLARLEKFPAKAWHELATNLPPKLLQQALAIARTIKSCKARAEALSGLVTYLPQTEQGRVVQETLTVVEAEVRQWEELLINESKLAAELAPLSSAFSSGFSKEEQKELANDFLETAQRDRIDTLCKLLPYFPQKEKEEVSVQVKRAAQSIKNEWERVEVFSKLLAHLPERERPDLLREVLAKASGWSRYDKKWLKVWHESVAYLPEAKKQDVLREGRAAAELIEYPQERYEALAKLLPYLAEKQDVLGQALAAAQLIHNMQDRFWALAKLLPHLAEPEKQNVRRAGMPVLHQALAAAQLIDNSQEQFRALSELLPHLTEPEKSELLHEALVVARGTTKSELSFGQLMPHLPAWAKAQPVAAVTAWQQILHDLSARPRPEFLKNLLPLLPFTLALAGEDTEATAEHIFQAMQEIAIWWP